MGRGRGDSAHRAAHGQPPPQRRPGQRPGTGRRARGAAGGDRPGLELPLALDWQRHHHILADLAADEPHGHLPHIAPGVTYDGDDLGRWLKQQKKPGIWAQLSEEQQQRLTALGVKPLEAPPAAPVARRATKGPSKAQQAFQRGLTALTQWVEREGAHRPVPRGAVVEIAVDGDADPVTVKLGVWISNTKTRRDKLTQEQLDALRELGMEWA
ncbi:helicase associated domain-containing protein [Streptomyces lavendofoliae]|uniref:helicase associated domain-containing protein n=1 Tax=Streptomyces lavendofoliae TaxID=67314 RepID=UPI003D8BAFBD